MRRRFALRASRLHSSLGVLVAAVACLALAGCFELEQTIVLDRDLSGTADVSFVMDMEPMAYMAASMKKSFAGEEGPPTEEEIATARAEMLAESEAKTKDPAEMEAEKRKMAESMPEGVELLDVNMREEGLKVISDFSMRFDHASRLAAMESSEGAGGTESQNPFAALQFEDEGDTFVLRTPESSPQMDQMSMMMDNDEGDPQMEAMFRGMRMAIRIKAPFEVVDSNATRREGDTLVWEQGFDEMMAMAEAQEPTSMVFVRYRK